MSISAVGSYAVNGGSGVTTLAVSPSATGNILKVTVLQFAANVTGLTGGGVTTWNAGPSYHDTSQGPQIAIFWGVITATGSQTITLQGSGLGSSYQEITCREYNESNAGWTWSQVAASPATGSSGASLGSGTTLTYPSLTASGATDYLYTGFAWTSNGGLSAGSTSGFTYANPFTSSTQTADDPSFSGSGGATSVVSQSVPWDAIGLLLGTKAGGTAHSATVSVTVTPSISAAATRGKFRTAALTITPGITVARSQGHVRAVSVTVVPSIRVTAAGGEPPKQRQHTPPGERGSPLKKIILLGW